MKTIIQKPDLDTCLTALIMGVSSSDDVVIVRGDASDDEILNPAVLCIEVGGNGLVHMNNFDHHDPSRYLSPACMQAYDYSGITNENPPSPPFTPVPKRFCSGKGGLGGFAVERLKRLVEYACIVDDRPKEHPVIQFPSLSNVFSGMLLVETQPLRQFFKGLEMLQKVLEEGIDSFSTMPDITEWRVYREAKERNKRKLEEVLQKTMFYESKSGLKIGYIESDAIGGIGYLYEQGCDVVIMYNPVFGDPPVRKFTVAGNDKKVVHLIEYFDKIERGWGGRETIIGSPRGGPELDAERVLEIVRSI